MWIRIYLFEVRYWLRSWLLWIFLLAITGASLYCCSSSDVAFGRGNCDWNAGFVIEEYYSIFSIFTLLMATVFVSSAANRDFASRSDEIVFSTPISKFDYLVGRFFGATTIAFVPTLGVSLGILAAKYAPWAKDGSFQAVNFAAHWNGILLFAIPNAFFIAAILFAVGVVTRSSAMSFVSAICVLTGYSIARNNMDDLKNERIGAMLDPFGTSTFEFLTKYWTSADKNKLVLGFHGLMLWNRMLWIGVGVLIFAWACHRFRFALRHSKPAAPLSVSGAQSTSPRAIFLPTLHATWQSQFLEILKLELRAIFKTISFLVLLACCLSILLSQLISKATEGYGNSAFPVTYKVLELLQGGLTLFSLVIALYFAGAVVWRERDCGNDEILDALPVPEWLSYAAKLSAVVLPMFLFQLTGILCGLLVQAFHGYTRFQPGVYLVQLLGIDFVGFTLLAVLAFFCHVVAPHKYAAFFLFPAIWIADEFGWQPLNVGTLMVRFGETPDGNYSDFFGWSPYRAGMIWFTLYWFAFCGLLAIATILLWRHGRETRWRHRVRNARLRLTGGVKKVAIANAIAFLAIAAVIFYNTKILHKIYTDKDIDQGRANYEKTYKRYQNLPQPKITSVKYWIDLDPSTYGRVMRCEEVIQNKTTHPIQQLHIDYHAGDDLTITVPGARLVKNDTRSGYRIYDFAPVLQPGEARVLTYVLKSRRRGFENGAGDLSVVSNGTFFNNQIVRIGYQQQGEVEENRHKYGLPDKQDPPEPGRNCTAGCSNNYFVNAADWIDIKTVIGTAPDQVAIAPGSLVKEWRANGHRYFEYHLDHPSMDFATFMSARYTVSRERWNGIDIEVYYIKEQPWNVPRMRESIRKSLGYYIQNFGPYPHKQARIIEFPRIAGFAQAYPGTMPYSESVGFIANLQDPEDIDFVFYVVAHEMAHQWWGHQVVGADVRGATFLSESLAQYSALMVMEKEYGRDMIRKFLRYENDLYLKGRAADKKKESPLVRVRDEQMYIRYNKASVVLYQLREMIGEEAMNRALRKLLARYAYAPPPYPTSYQLLDALRDETPPEYLYLIRDLLEDITLFDNRTKVAKATKRKDGRYDVSIECQVWKMKVANDGNEYAANLNDWIEVGAFAKPPNGKRYGKLLHRQRIELMGPGNLTTSWKFAFVTDEKPATAGIDPLNLLIEKSPDETMRSVD